MDTQTEFYDREVIDQTPYGAFGWLAVIVILALSGGAYGLWHAAGAVKSRHWFDGISAPDTSNALNSARDSVSNAADKAVNSAVDAGANAAQSEIDKQKAAAATAAQDAVKESVQSAATTQEENFQKYLGQ